MSPESHAITAIVDAFDEEFRLRMLKQVRELDALYRKHGAPTNPSAFPEARESIEIARQIDGFPQWTRAKILKMVTQLVEVYEASGVSRYPSPSRAEGQRRKVTTQGDGCTVIRLADRRKEQA